MNPWNGTNSGLLLECEETSLPWDGHLCHANNSTYKLWISRQRMCWSNEYTNANFDDSFFLLISIVYLWQLLQNCIVVPHIKVRGSIWKKEILRNFIHYFWFSLFFFIISRLLRYWPWKKLLKFLPLWYGTMGSCINLGQMCPIYYLIQLLKF